MITKEELQHTYSQMSSEELLAIIDNQYSHTSLAVSIAQQELSSRNLTEMDIQTFKTELQDKQEQDISENMLEDLSLAQKIFFYFIWLPLLTFTFKRSFVDHGSLLKLKQVHYYSLMGFFAFIIVCIINAIYDPYLSYSVTIVVALFVPSYLYDEFYNGRKQIERIERHIREEQDRAAALEDEEIEEVI